jgi:hypothetical protein
VPPPLLVPPELLEPPSEDAGAGPDDEELDEPLAIPLLLLTTGRDVEDVGLARVYPSPLIARPVPRAGTAFPSLPPPSLFQYGGNTIGL